MSTISQTDYGPGRSAWGSLRILVGGMFGMMVAMGIGRFVFTPILPLMQRDLGMTNTVAGWLAGLNYLGYLIGALACSFAPQLLRSRVVNGSSLLLSIATTFCMGTTLSTFWWGAMRLIGGMASAILFILISAEVAESLARRGHMHWSGSLYGGIGAGIALSGLLVPPLDGVGGWSVAWIGMGVLAALLALIGIILGRQHESLQPVKSTTVPGGASLAGIRVLTIAYFFEGLGYIVTATFLVAIIAATPGLATFAPYSWVAVGLAAVPSTVFWAHLARRIGARPALFAAYVLQGAGVVVSIGATSILAVLFVAVSFGGTFLGIVGMTLAEGSRRVPGEGRRVAAILTVGFGVGQMLGPVLAGTLADLQAGFTLPLLLAAVCIGLSGALTLLDSQFQIRTN